MVTTGHTPVPKDPRPPRATAGLVKPSLPPSNMPRADPRKRKKQPEPEPEAAAPAAAGSILLRGDDEPMDVDEALPLSLALAATAQPATATAVTSADADADASGGRGPGPGGPGLISPIVTPSPYPQHNAGPTATRFKTALGRVTQRPTRDIEAWQALLTEVQSCHKALQESAAGEAAAATQFQRQQQLDWMESCYGYLLQHFPYAAHYHVRAAQLLWAQTVRPGAGEEPELQLHADDEPAWQRRWLPGRADPPPPASALFLSPQRALLCEQKLEHLLRRTLGFDLEGKSETTGDMNDDRNEDGSSTDLGGVCVWCVELWLVYIFLVARQVRRQSAVSASVEEMEARRLAARERVQKAFELAVLHVGFAFNNHLLWKHYVSFVRSWTFGMDPAAMAAHHALAQQQMVQLRAVYQRAVCLPMVGLDQMWNDYESFERTQSEALAQALLQDFSPKYQHARTVFLERNRVYGGAADLQLDRLAADPVVDSDDDHAAKMDEEYKLIKIWKIRTSYQRTNPERLSPSDAAQRTRLAYKEMVSALTRYPECWHQWSMWELHGPESKSATRAIAVLQLGQIHVPDSTLLAYAEAQITELFNSEPSRCIEIMERLLARAPTTLGFVLCQQMVRRHKGTEEAREIFARARRVLVSDISSTGRKEEKTNPIDGVDREKLNADGGQLNTSSEAVEKKKGIITNRLNPSIGTDTTVKAEGMSSSLTLTNQASLISRGVLTWHLFAAHASIEHRLNGSREVAARIYELGLRRHGDFLAKPAYVLRYAQLLLDLGDSINLRALLRRAVAACEEQNNDGSLAALWDICLYFESLLDSGESCATRLDDIESKRRAAVLGPDVEDVATGGLLSSSDVPLIGAQKITISEQLIRSEGYDVSSKIMSGLSRTVDFLDVAGFWGSDGTTLIRRKMRHDKDSEMSSGVSDALYEKRVQFQALASKGIALDAPAGDASALAGSRVLSARERLQQQAAVVGGQSTAMMLVVQQSPEWLRPLLLMLPASKLRLPIVPKPPPHLVEMAVVSLRLNNLPAERPAETLSTKRKIDGAGGDSSDEEDGNRKGGGYGTAFRSRQRSRLTEQPANGSL